MRKRFLSLALALMAASCGLPRNVVVLIPDEGGTTGKVIVAHGDTSKELDEPYAALGTNAGVRSDVFVAERGTVQRAFSGALATTPRTPAIYVIYFVVADDTVAPQSTGTLAEAVQAARTTPNADISVVGHADATGDEDANRVLSLRRAQMVRKALVEAGVGSSAIEVNYHGSSNPRVPRPRGVPEPQNRRVEVTIR